jgi:epoxyqueuosine reductase
VSNLSADSLPARIRAWGLELGFADVGIAELALDDDARHLRDWLEQGFHGGMNYMVRSAELRSTPARLRPGTVSVISVRMDYRPPAADSWSVLRDGSKAFIARYALGRDYHRLMRSRLKKLAERLRREIEPFGYRVLADSAPALEKALGRNARLGWIGKNTLLLNRKAGSYFLLGEIYCDLPLPAPHAHTPPRNHCGSCRACMDICPTKAIVGPYRLDARRCISYLTIEHHGSIPQEFRKAIGNRIFGCDDCQLVCPWNRYARLSTEADFAPRHGLDAAKLTELFGWNEEEYLRKTEGMALRRTGYSGLLRNIAVALGNAPRSGEVVSALNSRAEHPDDVVREHVAWALNEQALKAS